LKRFKVGRGAKQWIMLKIQSMDKVQRNIVKLRQQNNCLKLIEKYVRRKPMPNLSQIKRKRMLEFLYKIKEEHKNDDEMLIALGEIDYLSNAYEGYTSGFATSVVRSTSETLFEKYCERQDDIDWVYKNGDSGQQYFSIVYWQGAGKQRLFYADYIVKKKDGTIWIIETKGGESKGKNKNIDKQIANKFNAFKQYAAEHNLRWGFVRDKDYSLYINNTQFSEDMAAEHWVPLKEKY